MIAQVVDVCGAEDVGANGDTAGVGLIEALEEHNHCRLATPGGADHRNALVPLDLDEQVFEHREIGVFRVREGNVGEGDGPRKIRGEDALGLIGGGGELEKPVESRVVRVDLAMRRAVIVAQINKFTRSRKQ